jgi:hypothetical protein
MLLVAAPLVAADLAVKAAVETPVWAYHQRSFGWVALCCVVLAGLTMVTRLPALFVPASAGVLAAGVAGNALSAAWNDLAVPNPLVIEGSSRFVAFNLADVWALVGIATLVLTIGLWLVRNRHLLPPHRERRNPANDPMTEETRTVF